MILVKRYPNRKLYNTSAKQYITLQGVAQLIRDGEEVQIVDHATGEDLTAVTLTQIILEQEKKEGGFLPRSVLTGLVQSGGQTLSSLRRTLALPLNLRLHVDVEIERRLRSLVTSGQLTEEESAIMREKLLSTSASTPDNRLPSEEELEQLLIERGIPTKEDIKEISALLDDLFAKLENTNT